MPLVRYAFERMQAAILERQAAPGDEILDRGADQHLGRAGERGHPCADMHGDPTHIVARDLDLAGVDPSPHLQAEWPERVADRSGRLAEALDRGRAFDLDGSATLVPWEMANRP